MPFLVFLLSLVILGLLLYIRYLRNKYVRPNTSLGNFQQLAKRPPKVDTTIPFLPGSKVGGKAILEDLEVKVSKREGRRKDRPFSTREDIRRSYLIDALLEKPKY
ncbi:MAG: hypothetical protein MRZ79_06050 [Bacteroidia bacterium]|nr:hypothetical protein [Bacteroidia bacterium]